MDQLKNDMASLKEQMDLVLNRQDEIAKLLAENNVLLRRNLGLYQTIKTNFPLESEEQLQELENQLKTEKRLEIVGAMKHILSDDGTKKINRIFGKDIIYNYNYDGVQKKKPLKTYINVLNALYEATKQNGRTYEDFLKDLRTSIHRIKNTMHKSKLRLNIHEIPKTTATENEMNKENKDNN